MCDDHDSSQQQLQLIDVRGAVDCTAIDLFVALNDQHAVAAFTDVAISPDGCMSSGPPRACKLAARPDQLLRITACKPSGEQLGQAVMKVACKPGWLKLTPALSLCLALEPTTTTPHVADTSENTQSSSNPTDEELRVAYELEQWCVEQQRRHTFDLEQRTATRLAALQAEWDKREQQRVAQLSTARDRCVVVAVYCGAPHLCCCGVSRKTKVVLHK